jgi:prolipoprotein diacylglyceryltransferase
MLYNLHLSKSKSLKIIKVWSLLLVSYGIIRFLMASINLFMNSIESTIVYQLTLWYHCQSALLIFLGVILFVNRSKIE